MPFWYPWFGSRYPSVISTKVKIEIVMTKAYICKKHHHSRFLISGFFLSVNTLNYCCANYPVWDGRHLLCKYLKRLRTLFSVCNPTVPSCLSLWVCFAMNFRLATINCFMETDLLYSKMWTFQCILFLWAQCFLHCWDYSIWWFS